MSVCVLYNSVNLSYNVGILPYEEGIILFVHLMKIVWISLCSIYGEHTYRDINGIRSDNMIGIDHLSLDNACFDTFKYVIVYSQTRCIFLETFLTINRNK
jgi:hypothetical protein